jgi:hypothetical protein
VAYTECIGAVAPAPECCAVALSELVERHGGGVPAAADMQRIDRAGTLGPPRGAAAGAEASSAPRQHPGARR